ncbi:MAG: SMC-Scp complex subunit ScpB [Nanoarchaeota archaeon]|nr:SMC-Scp complex subunit ScpB [Nanoarchaeota archaeon]
MDESNSGERNAKNVSSRTLEELDQESEKEDLRKLEAILFVAGRFLNMKDLVTLSDLNPIIIKEIISKLIKVYEESGSAIEIVKKGEPGKDMWKMDVRPEYSHIVNRLASGSSEFTKAEQETLAIIAFKQPIKQSVIIKIRGNKAYDHVKRFSELGLIKRKKIGHTNELSLSDEFYDYFSVSSEEGITGKSVMAEGEEVIEEEGGQPTSPKQSRREDE